MTNRTPSTVLREVFGHKTFRGDQEKAIGHILTGGDALILMPTGGGKSLCYQIPAICRPGVGVVVSPLIALMNDQVASLKRRGVSAEAFHYQQGAEQNAASMEKARQGSLDLLYVSPERFTDNEFLKSLADVRVSLFAIDEAHCISHWGHDFRESYRQLNRIRQTWPDVPIVALTATATEHTRADIIDSLGISGCEQFVGSFDRPNIFYRVRYGRGKQYALEPFLERFPDSCGIIYCPTRRNTETMKYRLRQLGYDCYSYHAGMPVSERRKVESIFTHNKSPIVAATIAFGLGIDRLDVRFVVHYGATDSLEAYYQESGRCGRDGQPAEACLLASESDFINAEFRIRAKDLPADSEIDVRRIQMEKLVAMRQYTTGQDCRRRTILNYFGEHGPDNCGNCDVCLGCVEVPPPRGPRYERPPGVSRPDIGLAFKERYKQRRRWP